MMQVPPIPVTPAKLRLLKKGGRGPARQSGHWDVARGRPEAPPADRYPSRNSRKRDRELTQQHPRVLTWRELRAKARLHQAVFGQARRRCPPDIARGMIPVQQDCRL